MSSNARSWLEAADADIDAVRRSLRPDPTPNLPIAAYHCQQAVEKLIKALLVHLSLPYLRGSGGHDLRRLIAQLPSTHPPAWRHHHPCAHHTMGNRISLPR